MSQWEAMTDLQRLTCEAVFAEKTAVEQALHAIVDRVGLTHAIEHVRLLRGPASDFAGGLLDTISIEVEGDIVWHLRWEQREGPMLHMEAGWLTDDYAPIK